MNELILKYKAETGNIPETYNIEFYTTYQDDYGWVELSEVDTDPEIVKTIKELGFFQIDIKESEYVKWLEEKLLKKLREDE